MNSRRVLTLLGLSLLFLALGVSTGRLRTASADAMIADEGPSDAARAVLAAFDADPDDLGEELYELFDELASGDEALLDRAPRYDWVDAYRLDSLRPEDLIALRGTAAAPAAVFGTRDPVALSAHLERAQGVFSAITVGCAFEALADDLASTDGESREEFAFAEQPLSRQVMRRSRRVTLPFGGATTDALLQVTVQVGPAAGDALEVTQMWELAMLVDRGDGSVRLVATWVEASTPDFDSANRLWAGWVLHGAFEDARVWTDACAGTRPESAGKNLEPSPGSGGARDEGLDTSRTRDGTTAGSDAQAPPAGGDAGATEPAPAPSDPTSPPLRPAPLCDGVRLIGIPTHALKMMESQYELDTISANIDTLNAERDAVAADPSHPDVRQTDTVMALRARGVDDKLVVWRQEGIRRWTEVVGTPRGRLTESERDMLGRLVDRFGADPDMYEEPNRLRIKARWASGAMREFLTTDDVVIPVCPDDLAYAADQLGWRAPKQRRAHATDVEQVVASALLEAGGIRAISDREWDGLRAIFGFGDSMMDLLSSPAPGIDAVDSTL